MEDIENKEDVKVFVDSFYQNVRTDPLIGPVFAARIASDRWPAHLEKMYGFWNTVLFAVPDYRGNPFSKHANMPLKAPHFERWVGLFSQTIDEHFEGEKAEEAKMRGIKMGKLFLSKLEYIQANKDYQNLI